MLVGEMEFGGRVPIDSYGSGGFRLAGQVHMGPLAMLPAGPQPWSGLTDMSPFLAAAGDIDVLLVGTGADPQPLPQATLDQLSDASIGAEVMATPAACRTYNVLLGEGRRIAAALLPL